MRDSVRFQWRLVAVQAVIALPLAVAFNLWPGKATLMVYVVVNGLFCFHQWQRADWGAAA